jgi:RNA polymerase sigma-70 factor (ECF subfamily)
VADNRAAIRVATDRAQKTMTNKYGAAVLETPTPVAPSISIDDELAAAASHGDEAAFAELLERYKWMVAGVGGRFFRHREEIEEAIQATFCRAYLSLRQFRGGQERSFAAWLKRIAITTCLDELKRIARRREDSIAELDQDETESLVARGYVSALEPDAERQTISRDLAGKLLARLNPEDRVALTLLYEEGWSVAEIGALLDWSVPKVKMRTFQARLTLRKLGQHFGLDLPRTGESL